ncbi:hypothetical protein [Rufibacter roseolus]|uniref:hypothetical protein n=1 Tax=Rufibacter roseolus TaxID=2817375 RepID=UPI001B308B00|nr:hypothetical protein [Rufibacter roseolus]
MKISFKHIFLLLASGVVFSSCLPDPAEKALVYNGPTVVEFKNHTLGMVASSATAAHGLDFRGILSNTGNGQTDSSRVISLMGYTIPATSTAPRRDISARTVDTVYVQLVGPQRSTTTEVKFEVFPAPNAAGTITGAVEGTDYTLEGGNSNKVVTIPANSSVGYIYLRGNAASFTGREKKRVGLRLLGAPDASPNPNYDAFYVTMTLTN